MIKSNQLQEILDTLNISEQTWVRFRKLSLPKQKIVLRKALEIELEIQAIGKQTFGNIDHYPKSQKVEQLIYPKNRNTGYFSSEVKKLQERNQTIIDDYQIGIVNIL